MNTTEATAREFKHRDDSNAAWGRCTLRDMHRLDGFYTPRHAKPVPMGGAA